MENKEEIMKNLTDGAMSLYNTVDIETNNKENTYTSAEDKIKEILGSEEPLFVGDDDEVVTMLFQYVNIGYGICGLKYLDMIINNKSIASMVLGYTLQKLNQFAEENVQLALKQETSKESKISEKEFKGVSE